MPFVNLLARKKHWLSVRTISEIIVSLFWRIVAYVFLAIGKKNMPRWFPRELKIESMLKLEFPGFKHHIELSGNRKSSRTSRYENFKVVSCFDKEMVGL